MTCSFYHPPKDNRFPEKCPCSPTSPQRNRSFQFLGGHDDQVLGCLPVKAQTALKPFFEILKWLKKLINVE